MVGHARLEVGSLKEVDRVGEEKREEAKSGGLSSANRESKRNRLSSGEPQEAFSNEGIVISTKSSLGKDMEGDGGEPNVGALSSQTISEGKSCGIGNLGGVGGVRWNEGTEISSKHSLGYCTGDGWSLIGERCGGGVGVGAGGVGAHTSGVAIRSIGV